MKDTLKRLLVAVLALVLLASAVVPAAVAAGDTTPVPKGSSAIEVYAGNKTTLKVYRNSVATSPGLYRWKSSNTSIATVNSQGVVVGNKAGTATITATHKTSGRKCKVTVRVKRNKADKISAKPAVSAAPYKSAALVLKSVEIVSPTRVDVEYYLPVNFPASWRLVSVEAVSDAINLFELYSGSYVKTIVGDKYQVESRKISGLKVRYGSSVQVIKVTYTGAKVNCANIKLSQYRIRNSKNAKARINYYRR